MKKSDGKGGGRERVGNTQSRTQTSQLKTDSSAFFDSGVRVLEFLIVFARRTRGIHCHIKFVDLLKTCE